MGKNRRRQTDIVREMSNYKDLTKESESYSEYRVKFGFDLKNLSRKIIFYD